MAVALTNSGAESVLYRFYDRHTEYGGVCPAPVGPLYRLGMGEGAVGGPPSQAPRRFLSAIGFLALKELAGNGTDLLLPSWLIGR